MEGSRAVNKHVDRYVTGACAILFLVCYFGVATGLIAR